MNHYMLNNTKRLIILSKAEYAALYELPDFDHQQRLDYLTLTEQEQKLALSYPDLPSKVYCILQIGYFKAKQIFFASPGRRLLKKTFYASFSITSRNSYSVSNPLASEAIMLSAALFLNFLDTSFGQKLLSPFCPRKLFKLF